MAVSAQVEGNDLVTIISGQDKVWTMKSQVVVPLANITEVSVGAPQSFRDGTMAKIYGKGLGAKHRSGYFAGSAGKEMWIVSGQDEVLGCILNGDPYARIILGVANPDDLCAAITAAQAGANPQD